AHAIVRHLKKVSLILIPGPNGNFWCFDAHACREDGFESIGIQVQQDAAVHGRGKGRCFDISCGAPAHQNSMVISKSLELIEHMADLTTSRHPLRAIKPRRVKKHS